LASVEKTSEEIENVGIMAGLKLDRRKTKAIWLGKKLKQCFTIEMIA